jgi:phage-related protein
MEPDDWKPVSVVGPGTIELRIHASGECRVFVVRQFAEAIYVLHVFAKTTSKAPKHDLDLGRRRYRDLVAERRGS